MSYTDPILGKCKYTGFYLYNQLVGGWLATCEKGKISCDVVPSREVIMMARKAKMDIHLAGEIWKEVGKLGWGEPVTPEEANILVTKLIAKRRALVEKALLEKSSSSPEKPYKTPEEIVERFIKGVKE